MSDTVKVVLIGAGGETGSSIVNGLVASSQNFDITAIVRPASIDKPANVSLKERGIKVVPAEITGPSEPLVNILSGVDVVVSAIGPANQLDQIPMMDAAKAAGVKRFVPCGFITVAPPDGVMFLRETKEKVYNYMKKIGLPYTVIDVGWWYQIAFPRLPSGRVDYAHMSVGTNEIPGDGNVPSALTDLRDIGRYVAKIIIDPRTLNKYVLAYNTLLTPNQVYDIMERLSDEKVERRYISEEQLDEQISEGRKALAANDTDTSKMVALYSGEYRKSWGIRGDNTAEYAAFLGYLNSKELYPDFKWTAFEDFLKQCLAGTVEPLYQHMQAYRKQS